MKVFIIAASTACGRIGPNHVGSPIDRIHLENMRARTDASLMGAETLRQGDPEMRGPDGVLSNTRLRAIISASGNIPCSDRKIFSQGPAPVVYTSLAAKDRLARELGDRAIVVGLPPSDNGLSLTAGLADLAARGAGSLLIEGGGRLNYACLAQGLVDEIFLTITPHLSGDTAGPLFVRGGGPLGDPMLSLALLACRPEATGEIFLHYKVNK